MQVDLIRIDDDFHFQASGTAGVSLDIDGSLDIGGHNAGARPMELLLMGLGGCTAIDVILILKKQRQRVDDFRIRVTGERVPIEGTGMSPFRKIHLHYQLKGDLDPGKVDRAVQLSMDKYCSATAQLSPTAEITHTVEVERVETENPA
ncbi:MAG: OsmC family protein [Sphingobacteriaceae bacterium]|nr:OsmC family protein [Cytophagaceae bacterium]